MSSVGIFGGTFNPVHNGHMHLAEMALHELKLDRLIFIPSNIPPHKSAENLCSNDDRFKMCSLAVSGIQKFQVSDYELKRSGKSYSVYTAGYFREQFPTDRIFMLIGSDMLMSFDSWYRYQDVLKMVDLAVVSRENDDRAILEKKADFLRKYGEIKIIDSDPYVISSTEIREKIKKDEKFSCYLPEKVVQYIRLNNLYK